MSSSQNPQEWETILSKLTEEKEAKQPFAGPLTVGIISFCLFNAFTALVVMLLNDTVNSAWENVDLFRPGIGYSDALALTGLLWVLYFLKVGVFTAIGKSNGSN